MTTDMKWISIIITTIITVMFPYNASAKSVIVDGIKYELYSDTDNHATVILMSAAKNHEKYKGDIVIPEYIENKGTKYRVTEISGAFQSCVDLISVSIPNTVVSIKQSAFYGCKKLKKITLPPNLLHIGQAAFRYCTSLESIKIPATVTVIDNYAFEGCSSLRSLEIPNSVKTIGDFAFADCTGLQVIVLSDATETIGSKAFFNCSKLESLTFPAQVKSIGYFVIYECKSLKYVECKGMNPPRYEDDPFAPLKDGQTQKQEREIARQFDYSIPLYVPKERVIKYKAAEFWRAFPDIRER